MFGLNIIYWANESLDSLHSLHQFLKGKKYMKKHYFLTFEW